MTLTGRGLRSTGSCLVLNATRRCGTELAVHEHHDMSGGELHTHATPVIQNDQTSAVHYLGKAISN